MTISTFKSGFGKVMFKKICFRPRGDSSWFTQNEEYILKVLVGCLHPGRILVRVALLGYPYWMFLGVSEFQFQLFRLFRLFQYLRNEAGYKRQSTFVLVLLSTQLSFPSNYYLLINQYLVIIPF